MKATVRTRFVPMSGDVCVYQTTVTIIYGGITAHTMPGKHTRKEALIRTFNFLVREGKTSSNFLQELKTLSYGRRKK